MALMFAWFSMHVNIHCMEFYVLIADRLKSERKRLGLTQESLAESAGIKRITLQSWERGLSSPPAIALSALGSVGMDVLFVLTGERQQTGIGEAAVHQAVLDAVDLLSLEDKVNAAQLAKAVVKLIAKSVPDTQPVAGQVINTNSGDGAQQNFVNSTVGSVTTGDVTLGRGKKKT
ncbi:helix-turn-helix transcriptional regulator [Aeromonas salmonicida subsp. achromogenes]|uniref:helix-turn-helix domain-containing protein n=2 Tax=Aeromonas salmonicida TaxID=645 RepID=UPI0003621790|nr:helix-turn-helix transcriptional regulator [Aeromonas salmonicida]TMX13901.1 helix-turn-helix transcriptional regulator [Aeromonas salmonicida subsp. achromogenes]TMX17596.1 helix-turn-helix transcriptional regulator [Aeromonas salmonicida subsp. achromogenes]TMX18218.1 helix-turn-helix transcriptional regulator [Aeromonas salmonicida subsp. achromogenes]TMX21176.1 helix-turn-helix transcriptional regulator [Aeromonas salmonicida subsp. achromogenes]